MDKLKPPTFSTGDNIVQGWQDFKNELAFYFTACDITDNQNKKKWQFYYVVWGENT